MAIDRDRILRSAEKHAARNRYKQAVEEYNKVLAASPNDARILLKVGDLYARMSSQARAIDAYARAGRIYADDGFAAKAVAVYKQVQQLLDDDAPHLADYYLYIYPTLAALYQELRLSAEAVGMYDAYANMLARCGRLREAATVLSIVVERGGDNPLTRLRLADLLIEEGEEQDALNQFVAAARSLVAMRKHDEAVKVLDHGVARLKTPALTRHAAEVLLDRGRPQDGMQALVRLQQAFKADPKNLDTLALLARAFEVIDQKDRAFEVRKETVRIAKEQGALEVARALVAELAGVAPNDPDVQALAKTVAPPPRTSMPEVTIEAETSIPEISAELVPPSIAPEPSAEHAVAVDADNLPIIEEAGGRETGDVAREIAATQARAREFVSRGELSRAIYTLQIGLEIAPAAVPLLSMLKDVFLQANEPGKAADQLVAIAEQRLHTGHEHDAIRALRQALALVPFHEDAQSMLRTLEPHGPPAPIPHELLAESEAVSRLPASVPAIPADVLLDDELIARKPLADIRGFRGGGAIVDALEEAEFFASRGLFEDALAIVSEQLEIHPDDPSLLDRFDQLRSQIEAELSGAHPSVLGVASPTEQANRVSQGADPNFLGSALAELQSPDEVQPNTVDLEGTLDVDDLFAAFKAGIAEQVGEGDSDMHYDLGVAYLEMGQLESAVDAFRKAAAAPDRACVSLSMIASIRQRHGDFEAAFEALTEASNVVRKTREEEVGVHYQLADLFEARADIQRAIHHFEQVVKLAPDFRDTRSRLRSLRGQSPEAARHVADDEFDRAFDGLLSGPDDRE